MTDVVPYEGHQPALPGDLAELARQALAQEAESKAPRTLDAYRRDWQAFTAWCEEHDLESLPATAATVRLYVAELSAEKRPTTIYRALAAIKLAHDAGGHPTPTKDPKLANQMQGIIRADARRRAELGLPAERQVKPATVEIVRRLVARLDRRELIGQRDAALVLLGFAGGFRRSELSALRLGDVEWSADGIVVTVRRSKTDQEGRGLTKHIVRGSDPDTCPVRALEEWVARLDGERSGPVFRAVDRHGNIRGSAVHPGSIARIIKRACADADIDEAEYSGHSLRRGMATTAARNGVHDRHIARLGGWVDGSRVLARYIDDGRSWNDTASGKLGL